MLGLHDARLKPQIPTLSVWLSVLGMYVLRLRSFNALEQELRIGKRWEAWIGSRKPSADTIGRVVSKMSPDELRQVLALLHRNAWRRKAVHMRPGESYRVVAVDGHEVGASWARCCSDCLVREISVGEKTVLEYYHRVVVAQWVGVTPPGILDLEPVRPKEGEVIAARRLLQRVLRAFPRLIDVISADALYLEAPFFKLVLDAGKHLVVVMKQEARDLFQDAERLRGLLQPEILIDGRRTTRLWDISNLSTFTTLDRPVRVVWAEEETLKRKVVGGEAELVQEKKTWIWVTDLSAATVPASKIQLWGHDRWNLENRGFNELVNLWHMDHYFIHDPTAIEVLLLTLAVAFVTTYLFYERNLRAPARRHLTRLAMTARLADDLVLLGGASVWAPAIQPSG